MLKVVQLSRRDLIHEKLTSFNFGAAADQKTWVVPDLRSKLEIQSIALKENGFFLDESVLRASDFWKLLLRRLNPSFQVVSADFIQTILASFLKKHSDLRTQTTLSESLLLQAMTRFAGMIFHPQGESLMREWFESHPEASSRWQEIYLVARAAFAYCQHHRVLMGPWVAPFLLAQKLDDLHWDKNLFVDLGAEMSGAEAQLLVALSHQIDVVIFEPTPKWRKSYSHLLKPYDDIRGFAQIILSETPQKKTTEKKIYKRFTSSLAEVKDVVFQVRQWLESGVPANEIAILSPDVEYYWPILEMHFREEGIPTAKATTVKLSSLPSVGKWLARLRLYLNQQNLQSEDLEISYYGSAEHEPMDTQDFKHLFTHLYGPEDLHRHIEIEKFVAKGAQLGGELSRDEFILSAAHFWDARVGFETYILIIREILQNAAGGWKFSAQDWLKYSELFVAKKEISLDLARDEGIQITSIQGARTVRVSHRYFIGLSEEHLRQSHRSPLLTQDIVGLSDLGFYLDHPDQGLLNFELSWLGEIPTAEDIYSVPMTDFEGAVLNPSSMWIRGQLAVSGGVMDSIQLPRADRWEILKQSPPAVWGQERGWDSQHINELEIQMARDLGQRDLPIGPPYLPSQLSPTGIKSYRDCPFQSAIKYLFRLNDQGELDLDMGAIDQGSLVHAFFQEIMDLKIYLYTDSSDLQNRLTETLESLRLKLEIKFADQQFWKPFCDRLLKLGIDFCRVELDWARQFQGRKEVCSEVPWEIYFETETETGCFSTLVPPGDAVKISGRIDRLELDHNGNAIVLDYKRSANHLSSQASWLEKNDLQLLFYLWAVEKGAISQGRLRIVGAFYYIYKDFSRSMGLHLDQPTEGFQPEKGGRNANATEEQKKELQENLEKIIAEVTVGMRNGDWRPTPRELGVCDRCQWSDVCRAPHLN